jgi:HK97 family phage portal protein
MGLFSSAIRSAVETSGIATPEKWLVNFLSGGTATAAGVNVDTDTAMNFVDFFAGVRAISEDVGSLPLPLYERLMPRGKKRAPEHPLYEVLHDQANEFMTSFALRETLQGHALTWGDGCAYIERDKGHVVGLWPLRPDRLTPKFAHLGRGKVRIVYLYTDPVNGIRTTLLADEVLHVAGLGFDGLRGYSLVSQGRQAIALGIATERFGAAWFRNGSRPAGVLTHPNAVSEGARTRMKQDWEELHRGLDRAQRVAILEEGVKWESIGIPPEDAQFLQTRQFQKGEMATLLRIAPHKIGDLEHATFSNIEELGIDHVVSTIRPWCIRWEQSIRARLLTDVERKRYFAEHLIDGLMRGDMKSRFEAYAIAKQWGWESSNDIREKENENPIGAAGDVYLVPLNMVNAADLATGGADGGGPRSKRSVAARRKVASRFVSLFEDADRRIARMEQAEVESLIRRHLDKGHEADFDIALNRVYEEVILPRSIDRWRPTMSVLAEEIAKDAADDAAWIGGFDWLDRFVRSYVESHAAYRVGASKSKLRGALAAGGVDALRAELQKLVDERPARTALWESNQLPNAVARETWRHAGVRDVRWVTVDECAFCLNMADRVTEIETPFLAAGDEVPGGDGDAPLSVARTVFHPPIHPGCTCAIAPA